MTTLNGRKVRYFRWSRGSGPCYALAISYDILALLSVRMLSERRVAPKFKGFADYKQMMRERV